MDRLRALAAEPKTEVAPRRALPGEACGIAVSGALACDSALERALFAPVYETLDRVHGDGRLPRIRVALTHELVDEEGSFDPEPQPGFPGGQVLISVISDFPRMTLLHELGHVIDGYGFGVGRYYGSARMDRFEQWRRVIEESQSVQRLRRLLLDPVLRDVDKEYLNYLLLPSESWARCYVQYIACHTDDARLERELGRFLLHDSTTRYPSHWGYGEFGGIATAIGRLFRSMSWLR